MTFSLQPDEHMRYIYDQRDRRYHLPETRDLRDRRDAALRSCPQCLIEAEYHEEEQLRRDAAWVRRKRLEEENDV